MNIYICLKPVTLYGIQYEPGDVIPSEAVLSTRIRALKNQGVIIESSLQDKGPPQPGSGSGGTSGGSTGGTSGGGTGGTSGGGTGGGEPDNGSGEATGGADGGYQQIDDILAEGTAALVMQALDNRKAVHAAMRASKKGGAS